MKLKGSLVAVIISVAFLGCQVRQLSSVPADLIGVWKTAEKKYADRYFELKEDRVIFATGIWQVSAHPIDRIEERGGEGKILYIIYYSSYQGDQSQFAFYYDPSMGVIRFRNQEQFEWIKWREGAPIVGPGQKNDSQVMKAL